VALLVAAAVVALAVAATLLPHAFSRHSRPAHPKPAPSPSLPAAPALDLHCAKGQQQVTGVGARYTDTTGGIRYAYEYYCVAADGSRTGSEINTFRVDGGQLVLDQGGLLARGQQQYVMSMTGTDGGLIVREYDANPGLSGHPGGVVSDIRWQIDAGGVTGVGNPIAQPCLAADLKAEQTSAHEPIPHLVLRVTNRGHSTCSVWGTPRYSWLTGQHESVLYSVRGQAGGLAAGQLSAPPLLLAPGQSGYASIGSQPDGVDNAGRTCVPPTWAVTLPNGVSLGRPEIGLCGGSLVSYPLVTAPNGSVDHPESEAPPAATGSCVDSPHEVLSTGPVKVVGNRSQTIVTVGSIDSTTCTISGYPDVRALDPGAGTLLLIAPRTPSGPLGGLRGSATPPTVTASHDQPASALIEWSRTGSRCFAGGRLAFLQGGNSLTFDPMGRFCDLQVHPFVPGATGSG
jgi:hypothetical protein